MLAELAPIIKQVDAVSTSLFDLRRRGLRYLLDHGVSQRECARVVEVTPMAVNLAVRPPKSNGSTSTT